MKTKPVAAKQEAPKSMESKIIASPKQDNTPRPVDTKPTTPEPKLNQVETKPIQQQATPHLTPKKPETVKPAAPKPAPEPVAKPAPAENVKLTQVFTKPSDD